MNASFNKVVAAFMGVAEDKFSEKGVGIGGLDCVVGGKKRRSLDWSCREY